MELTGFLQELRRSGRVVVDESLAQADLAAAAALLDWDRQIRLETPAGAPPHHAAAAMWGAVTLHSACRLFAHRALGPEAVAAAFADQGPQPITPEAVFSADLTLRYLPGLVVMARAAAADDPLVAALLALGSAWPLSSVGIAGCVPSAAALDAVWANRCLRTLYVDRVLKSQDKTRLADPRVREAALAALGAYPDLCPDIAEFLARPLGAS